MTDLNHATSVDTHPYTEDETVVDAHLGCQRVHEILFRIACFVGVMTHHTEDEAVSEKGK